MLVLHVPQALKYTTTNGIAQVLRRRLWVYVAQVHRPVQPLATCEALERVGRKRHVGCKRRRERVARSDRRQRRRALRDETLCSGRLRRLRGGLLALRDVRAAILTVVDALARPRWLGGERVDDLRSGGDGEEVDETDVLVAHNLHLVDQAEAREVITQLLLGHCLVEPAEVHVATSVALLDRERNLRGHGRRLAPADLELLAVQRELLDERIGVEGCGRRAVEEGKEDTRLFGQDADRLERAEVHQVEKLIDGRGGGEVAHVDGPRGSVGLRGERGGQRSGRVGPSGGRRDRERGQALLVESLLQAHCDQHHRNVEADRNRYEERRNAAIAAERKGRAVRIVQATVQRTTAIARKRTHLLPRP